MPGGIEMNRRQAGKARGAALNQLSYRAWSLDPATAEIPAISVLTDPRLHAREADRVLRRAQNGCFDTVAPVYVPVFAA